MKLSERHAELLVNGSNGQERAGITYIKKKLPSAIYVCSFSYQHLLRAIM